MAPIIRYITPQDLRAILNKNSPKAALHGPGSLAIIDVRDSDHVGGNIRDSLHYPSGNFDVTLPEIVRKCWDKEHVVLHCALSQQRGPKAARRYAEVREKEWDRKRTAGFLDGQMEYLGGEKDSEGQRGEADLADKQKTYILTGGFVKWQELYGSDENITADYVADIVSLLLPNGASSATRGTRAQSLDLKLG
ncbi:hypothetical protein MMC25_006075 [Agyrium rufum]|nr:hypothetical protein [Agyrium rufum]